MSRIVFPGVITGSLTAILVAWCMAAAWGQGLSIYPTRVFLSGAPGQTVKQQLAISNTGTLPVAFRTYLKDWVRDSVGAKVYSEPGSLSESNAAWVEASPAQVEILPGDRQYITVSLHVPADTSGQRVTHSMLFISQVNEQKGTAKDPQGRSININIKLEAGIHIYNTPPGFAVKNLEFLSFSEKTTMQDSVRRLTVKIRNTGQLVTDAQVKMELTNKQSGEEMHLPLIPISMLPGAEQRVSFDIPLTLKGNFLAVAFIDCGPDENLKVAEKQLHYGP